MFGSNETDYAFQLFIPLCLVVAVMLVFGVAHFARPGSLTWNGFANSIGQLAVVLYITLAIISMIPCHCYLHPDGKTSIIEYPTVLCDDSGKYPDMSAMGIIGVLLNVPRWY